MLEAKERDQLRRQLGLLTVREAAQLTGSTPLHIDRAIALEIIPLQMDGNGRRLVDPGSIHHITHDPELLDMPATEQSWFATSKEHLPMARLGKMDPRSWSKTYTQSTLTLLEVALLTEARLQARYCGPRGGGRPIKSVDELYNLHPDEMRRLKNRVRSKLESLTVKLDGEERRLSRLVPRLSKHIDKALQEAF